MKDSLIHIAQVVGANTAALTVALSNINALLTTISLILATIYTIYKFFKEIFPKKK
jgi:hypothetical protein